MSSDNSTSLVPCYIYDPEFPDAWGKCCDELNIVPKPLFLVLLFTLPIEAALTAVDRIGQTDLYNAKQGRAIWVFLFYNLASLGLLLAEFPWKEKECFINGSNFFECYQGILFMFYNSTGAMAALTVWMIFVVRKVFWHLFIFARTIIWPRIFWQSFENTFGGHLQFVLARDMWLDLGIQTNLYWYNILLIIIALIFGGLTHIIPMIIAFPWIQGSLIVSLLLAHATRVGYLDYCRKFPKQIKYPNLRSVFANIFIFYPLCLGVSFIMMVLVPFELVFAMITLPCLKLCAPALIHTFWKRTTFTRFYSGSLLQSGGNDDEGNAMAETIKTKATPDLEDVTKETSKTKSTVEEDDMENEVTTIVIPKPKKLRKETGMAKSFRMQHVREMSFADIIDEKPPPKVHLQQKSNQEEVVTSPAEQVETSKVEKQNEEKIGKRLFEMMLSILKSLCMYDPDGRLIMFAASTIFFIFTFSANYGILLYSGAPYYEIPKIDFLARRTVVWGQCSFDNFVNFSGFGFVDFIGLAIGVVGGAVAILDFFLNLFSC